MQHTMPRLLAAFCSMHYFGLLFVTFDYFCLLLGQYPQSKAAIRTQPTPRARKPGASVLVLYWYAAGCNAAYHTLASCSF